MSDQRPAPDPYYIPERERGPRRRLDPAPARIPQQSAINPFTGLWDERAPPPQAADIVPQAMAYEQIRYANEAEFAAREADDQTAYNLIRARTRSTAPQRGPSLRERLVQSLIDRQWARERGQQVALPAHAFYSAVTGAPSSTPEPQPRETQVAQRRLGASRR